AGADIVMLDNFKPESVARAIAELEKRGLRDKILVEVSGGITPDNIEKYLELGVDIISLGWITHSAPAIDLSLEIVEVIR
ncbi:MAG: carboxylating.nicotinate-nucleotide diphosphorylase, partial [Thermoprotei archaeon]